MQFNLSKKEWTLIGGFILVKFSLHLFLANNYELHRDALLYYSLGQHLDWGFVSVPPLIGFMSRLSTLMFGASAFGLRFFPAMMGGCSMLLIALIVKSLGGKQTAIILALFAYLFSPSYLRTCSLFQPVVFNQFFWLLSGFLGIQLIRFKNNKIWIWLFIVFVVGFMNKYSIVFLMAGFLIALLVSSHRKLLFSKYFLAGGILFLGIIAPNLIWQGTHGWPVVHHMAELQRTQLVHVGIAEFIIAQLTMNLPGFIVWISGLTGFLFIRKYREYRFIGIWTLCTIAILLFLRGKAYYTLGLYPVLFAMGGVVISEYFKRAFHFMIPLIIAILLWPLIPSSLPILSHAKLEAATKPLAPFVNRWEDGEIHAIPQDYADMTGWKQLSDIVFVFYDQLPDSTKGSCQIYADNYGMAGSLLYYGKSKGLPEPICFNDNFILWAPDSISNGSLIYVNHQLSDDIAGLYENCRKVGEVNDPYFRENGLKVFYCFQAKKTFQNYYAETVSHFKKRYH